MALKRLELRPVQFHGGKPKLASFRIAVLIESDSTLFYESRRRSIDDLRRKWAFTADSLMKDSRKSERCSICVSQGEEAIKDTPKSIMVWNPIRPTLEYQLLFFPKRHVEFPEQLELAELVEITNSQSRAFGIFLEHKNLAHPEGSLLVFGGMNWVIGQSSRHLHFRLEGLTLPSDFQPRSFAREEHHVVSGHGVRVGVAPPLDIVITAAEPLAKLASARHLCEYKLATYKALHALLNSSTGYRYPYTEFLTQSESSLETSFRLHVFDHPGVTESCSAYEVSVDLSVFAEKLKAELSRFASL